MTSGSKWFRRNKTKIPHVRNNAIKDHAVNVHTSVKHIVCSLEFNHLQSAIVDCETYPMVLLRAALAIKRMNPNKKIVLDPCNPSRKNRCFDFNSELMGRWRISACLAASVVVGTPTMNEGSGGECLNASLVVSSASC